MSIARPNPLVHSLYDHESTKQVAFGSVSSGSFSFDGNSSERAPASENPDYAYFQFAPKLEC